ncbi:hypothetical protein [Rickettsia endosymbiont of Urophora cardui]|uniref:hypothetical protein n=1 Tax=Rickettsia endosymbiont of Urophora cardui TaxID=3066265 RepID=UPI003978E9AF
MEVTTIGIDIAKRIFQIHGVDKNGKTVLKKKLMRDQVLTFMANLPQCLVGRSFALSKVANQLKCNS